MKWEQIFVGGVSSVLGVLALIAAIHNHDRYYRLPKAAWVERRWGRNTARLAFVALGLVLILLGLAIAMDFGRGGFGQEKTSDESSVTCYRLQERTIWRNTEFARLPSYNRQSGGRCHGLDTT